MPPILLHHGESRLDASAVTWTLTVRADPPRAGVRRTLADDLRLVEPIRVVAEVASPRLDLSSPWSRTDTAGDAATPTIDAHVDIVGNWRFETGGRTTLRRDGDRIVGTTHELRRELLSLGHTEGMEGHRLQRTDRRTYRDQTVTRGLRHTVRHGDAAPRRALTRDSAAGRDPTPHATHCVDASSSSAPPAMRRCRSWSVARWRRCRSGSAA